MRSTRLPGTRLLALPRRLVDPTAVSNVLEPLVADWQREWLAADSAWQRASVRVRGGVAFASSAAYCFAVDTMPDDVRRRAWTTVVVFIALGAVPLTVPFLPFVTEAPAAVPYALPSILPLSAAVAVLPLAMLLGTSANRAAGRRHLARFTLAIGLFVFVFHNGVTPSTNQTFRERLRFQAFERAGKAALYRPPRRGLRELTLPELLAVRLSAPNDIASPAQVNEELHRRIALPLVPVLLAIMGWSLTRLTNAAGAGRLLGWWAFAGITYGFAVSLGTTLERSWHVPRELAVWLPLALWSAASIVLMRWNARRSISGGSEDPPLPKKHGTAEAVPYDR